MILSVFIASALPVVGILAMPVEVPAVVRESALPLRCAVVPDPAEFAIESLPAQGVGPWLAGSPSRTRIRLNKTPLGYYYRRRVARPP